MRRMMHFKAITWVIHFLMCGSICAGEESPVHFVDPVLLEAFKSKVTNEKETGKVVGNIHGLHYLLDLEIANRLNALDPGDGDHATELSLVLGLCSEKIGAHTAKAMIRHIRHVMVVTTTYPASSRGLPEALRPAFDSLVKHASPDLVCFSILDFIHEKDGRAMLDDTEMSIVLGRLWMRVSVPNMPPWFPKEEVNANKIRKQSLELLQKRKVYYESKGKDEAENLRRITKLIEVVLRTPVTVMDLKE